ncbi:MAG: hypothetical protein ACERKD_04370 [Prolixibacteraceae bacterium]
MKIAIHIKRRLANYFLIFATIVIIFTACKNDKDFCRLSNSDKEFVLEEYDFIEYLENGINSVKIEIETEFTESWFETSSYLSVPYGGIELVKSGFYTPDSSRYLKITSAACRKIAHIEVWEHRSFNSTSWFEINKDTLSSISCVIQNTTYQNCYVFSDTIDIKELIYVKNYGVVKLELLNGYTLELISIE